MSSYKRIIKHSGRQYQSPSPEGTLNVLGFRSYVGKPLCCEFFLGYLHESHVISNLVLFCPADPPATSLIRDLDAAVQYRSRAFAATTKHSYMSHLRSYIRYCEISGDASLPMSPQSLCRYAVYLAQRLDYSSIPKYLNILRILHLECSMDNPLKDNWFLNTVLKGIKQC